MHQRFVLVTGCSGGGKSTLIEELARRGHRTVEEPGRRIVREELAGEGSALPWIDLAAFARRAIRMAVADWRGAHGRRGDEGWIFFDRGVIDAASAFQVATARKVLAPLARRYRYRPLVFLAPPWPEIHAGDAERRHGFDAATEEYERLANELPALGYETRLLPKAPVAERAAFVLAALERG
ncbi:AAA family ATPase [Stappia sp. TSB10P1A]|uniref:AAA family ATPase n=1 Tax=Stappia sp. TSB10P1A TaxID=2003585 RepID=UPI001643EB7A|nr:AAA family ATPase [Stappia sp. TSB10P1A]